jgi:flagellar P-ring protein precursor FlgI
MNSAAVNRKNRASLFITLAIALIMALPGVTTGARIKDITTIGGMRDNQLIGYGLMVGLKNTGDSSYKTPFTIQTLLSMLKRLGTTVDIRQITGGNVGVSDTRKLRDVRVENVAAVMVTATLPPFAKPGSRIDVHVSSLGDASSLEGGMLLLTPLKGSDGNVYAVAQGDMKNVHNTNNGKNRRRNRIITNGVIQNAAVVEKEIIIDFASKTSFNILLNSPDFATANSMVEAVNARFGAGSARGLDGGTLEVILPIEFKGNPFGFISEVESLEVERDTVAKVVLNEKTGTVVIGQNVQISNVAISFGETTVEVKNPFYTPPPSVKEKLNMVQKNTDIKELVSALNALGVSPQDLVSIFKSLRAAGALNAELEIIS